MRTALLVNFILKSLNEYGLKVNYRLSHCQAEVSVVVGRDSKSSCCVLGVLGMNFTEAKRNKTKFYSMKSGLK